MPATGQLIEATVKWPAGKIFEGEWGPRQSVTLQLPDGTEEKIWFKPGMEPHSSLQKGQPVKVLVSAVPGKNGKHQYTFISDNPVSQPSSPAPKKSAILSDEDKRNVAEYIEQQSKLLKFCLTTAQKECGEICPSEEGIRSLGVSLYIAAQRKFNL